MNLVPSEFLARVTRYTGTVAVNVSTNLKTISANARYALVRVNYFSSNATTPVPNVIIGGTTVFGGFAIFTVANTPYQQGTFYYAKPGEVVNFTTPNTGGGTVSYSMEIVEFF